MPPNPSRTSRVSDATTKRRVAKSRELYLAFFSDALNALLSNDESETKAISEEEADEITASAGRIAESALKRIEERFPIL